MCLYTITAMQPLTSTSSNPKITIVSRHKLAPQNIYNKQKLYFYIHRSVPVSKVRIVTTIDSLVHTFMPDTKQLT